MIRSHKERFDDVVNVLDGCDELLNDYKKVTSLVSKNAIVDCLATSILLLRTAIYDLKEED